MNIINLYFLITAIWGTVMLGLVVPLATLEGNRISKVVAIAAVIVGWPIIVVFAIYGVLFKQEKWRMYVKEKD